jgi:hypothetical protein
MPHELRQDEIKRRERALREPEESALSGAFRERLAGAATSRRQATHDIDRPGPEADEVGLVGTALRDAMGDGAAAVEKAEGPGSSHAEEPVAKAIGDRLARGDISQLLKGRRVIDRKDGRDTLGFVTDDGLTVAVSTHPDAAGYAGEGLRVLMANGGGA